MRWVHPDLPGRRVRLAYGLNLHAADDLDSIFAGICGVTLPLRDRLVREGDGFGVGLYLPAAVSHELASPAGAAALERLSALVRAEGLDPFTFNAFPYGGFHRSGLKARVFEPSWAAPERLAFTLAVARVAHALWEPSADEGGHVSISTHPGRFGPWGAGEESLALAQLTAAARELAAIEARGGPRIVLAIEAEPRASAGDTRAAAALHARLRDAAREGDEAVAVRRHLGTCLDCCHSAVEFEEPEEAIQLATRGGTPLGKLQFSSALALARPAARPAERALLLGMAEERYLHQVTGRSSDRDGERWTRAADLPELARALEGETGAWLACDEWRCHFHVPVDLVGVGGSALATTRAHADRLLDLALAHPERWGSEELHLEIETYTWDVLPGVARGAGALVDGLEREYRHVLSRLAARGWQHAPARRIGRAPR